MLFRKKMPKSCSYCRFATALNDNQVLCIKKGIADASTNCRKFKYDPCKRVPVKAKALDFEKYSKEDFSL